MKRNTKPNEEPINNNLEGLAQYFAASNIRNKVILKQLLFGISNRAIHKGQTSYLPFSQVFKLCETLLQREECQTFRLFRPDRVGSRRTPSETDLGELFEISHQD